MAETAIPQTAPVEDHDPRPGAGRPLEPRHYLDPEVATTEMQAIFSRTWQYACHISQIAEPGRYVATTAGDQPVLVVRTQAGELRAWRNVCRHRGSELLTGSGACKKAIRCRYHGWTYDAADGRLLGVPEHRSFEELDKDALGLFPVRVEVLSGLVFVNLDAGSRSLAESTEGLRPLLDRYGLERLECFSSGTSGSQPANWKIVVENYLEGYHVPIAHPGLMRLLDYQRYDLEVREGWARFDSPLREKPSENRSERLYQRLVRPLPGLEGEDRRTWRYAFIYPNTTIDLYPDQVNIWKLLPTAVERTDDLWACFRQRRPSPMARFVQRLNNRLNIEVLREDVDLVRRVQTGVRTHGLELGPLAAAEGAIGWFAERVRADLAGAGS